MGNCCKFIKRSTRYRNDEKVDQIGYRQTYQTNHANTNPIACNSDISINKNKYYKSSFTSNHSNHVVIANPLPVNSSFSQYQQQQQHHHIHQGYEASASYENKSEDGNLSIPHIADFYPEDNNTVPADNPRTSTLFLPKASIDKNKKQKINETQTSSETNLHTSKKYNSCSTIYVDDSTVSNPNLKSAIRLVAYAIHCHIKERSSDRSMEIFDEKLYPLSRDASVPNDYNKIVPDPRVIYKFMKNLFTAAQLTAECAIVTLIYLERVLTYAEIDLCPANWKRLLLGSILLASKVWDDQAVWNVDYCQILKDINVENMNELERQYLTLMQFNINVPSSVYAKYYFDLRELAEANNISFPHEQLTKEKALKLEALSSVCQDKYNQMLLQTKSIRRTASADNLNIPSRKSLVILS